jgi:hypothetical protein
MKSVFLMWLAAFGLLASAAEVGDVHIDDTAKVAGQTLVLNGAAVRNKFGFIKVYVGALYTAQKVNLSEAVIGDSKPRRISLTMLRNVDSDKLHESLLEGLEANITEAELASLQTRIREMNAIFQSVNAVNKGDVVTLDFLPGKGTQITLRGQVKDVIAGDDFGRALMKVWLGKRPVSADLKAAMLGSK